MTDDPLFDFAVPEDLLREAVSQVKDAEVVADLAVMPGTGEGKPPPLIGILQKSGYAPLVLLTAAALVPGTFGNGIALIGKNLETSFHMSNASLGAVAFIAQVSQLLWAVPLALWADRGSRKLVAGVALLIFAGFGSLMAISPNVWWFAFLYLAASVGTGVNNTVHNSYLSDAYPTESRGRVFSWHNLSDPLSQTIGILIFGYVVTVSHNWRYGLLVALAGIPLGFALFTLREPEKGANESQPHPQGVGHGPAVPAGEGAPRPPRLRGHQAAAGPLAVLRAGGRRHPRLRRDGRAAVRQPVLHRQVPPRHRRRGARCTPSSVWPPSSGSRWPTSSATATSAAPPSARWSSPASASRPTAGSSSCRSTCPSSGWS